MTLYPSVLVLGALLIAGCTKESEETVSAPKPNPALERALAEAKDPTSKMARAVSGKPGADVDLKYDILSKPEPGVPSEVKLAIVNGAPSDRLTFKISGMDGLTLAGTLEGAVDKPTNGQIIEHTFSLLPDKAGIYYATVTVMVQNAGSQMGRTFSVPLLVGDVAATQKPAVAPQKDAKGQAIQPMKAEEH